MGGDLRIGAFFDGDPEDWRSFCGMGRGSSSGIGILLRCTVRLEGGLYAFDGGPSSLMRCDAAGWVS
jgi:hypothetical protein